MPPVATQRKPGAARRHRQSRGCAPYTARMQPHLRSRFRYLRARGQAWLARHPRALRVLELTGCLRKGPEAVARGILVGLFIGLTPTVGAQTLLMVLGCLLLRANFPSAFAVSWVSNPFTVAPLYWLFHGLGEALFEQLPLFSSDLWIVQGIGDDIVFAGMGSLVIATPVALFGYALTKRLSLSVLARRAQGRGSV